MRILVRIALCTLAYAAGRMLFGESYFAGYVVGVTLMLFAEIAEDLQKEKLKP